MGPTSKDPCPYKKSHSKGRRLYGHRGRGWSDASTSQGIPEAGRGRGNLPLQVSEGALPCQHLGAGHLASRTVRKWIHAVSATTVCGIWLGQPQGIHCLVSLSLLVKVPHCLSYYNFYKSGYLIGTLSFK